MLNYQRVYSFFLGLSFDIGYPGPSFHFLFGLAHILTWDMQAWSRGFMEFQHCKNHHLRTLVFFKKIPYTLIINLSSISPAFIKPRHSRRTFERIMFLWESYHVILWIRPEDSPSNLPDPLIILSTGPSIQKKTTSITKSRSSKIICVPCSCWRARRVP